eukprot:2590718-Rhodomonas_salina.1
MCSTAVAYDAICPRTCYAMPGTDPAYMVRSVDAMPGTGITCNRPRHNGGEREARQEHVIGG